MPAIPEDLSALIYYFEGIEPAAETQIIQPVLQWGNSPAGGGQFWGYAIWEVFSGVAVHTDVYQTGGGTGDSLQLTISLTNNTTNGCVDEWTNDPSDPLQSYCGTEYEWQVTVTDKENNAFIATTFYNVDNGPDAPPNGCQFPVAFPAVFESYGDVACENSVEFSSISLAPICIDPFGNCDETYTGTEGPTYTGDSPSCFNGTSTSGTTTWVY